MQWNDASLDQEAHSYGGNNINDFMGYVKSGGSQSIAQNDAAAVRIAKPCCMQEPKRKQKQIMKT